MKKSNAIISISLLAGALIIPSVGAYADPNPPGNSRQREELRRDQRQLEQLRQRHDHELREGDRREAREYNEKIRDQQRGRFVKIEEQSTMIVTAGIVMTGVATVITTMITIVTRFKFAFECAKGRQGSGGLFFCTAPAENSPSLSRASRHVRRILRAKSVQVIRYGCWFCHRRLRRTRSCGVASDVRSWM